MGEIMEKICLDFETALDFLRGEGGTIEKLRYYADREEICVTSLTLLHLYTAVKKPEVVKTFANSITILPFDKKATQMAASINQLFAERNEPLKTVESTTTAAICLANDAFLYSKSPSNYDGIKGLRKV